jgi:hypothetical protein
MKKIVTLISLLVFILVNSCTFTVNDKPPADQKADGSSTSPKIRNGIEVHTKGGLKVSQAFLLYDDGSLVPASNQAGVNQNVNLRLIIDNGFTESNGKVEIGASEKIETNTGQLLLNEPDLFTNLGEIEAERATALTLKAVITRLDKLYDYFLVSFRVWDKKGKGEVTGAYKLYIQ